MSCKMKRKAKLKQNSSKLENSSYKNNYNKNNATKWDIRDKILPKVNF